MVNLFQKYIFHFTEKSIQAINIGIKEMVNMRKYVLIPEYILLGLIEQTDSSVIHLFNELKLDSDYLRNKILSDIFSNQKIDDPQTPVPKGAFNITVSREVEYLFDSSLSLSTELGDKYISASILFIAMFDDKIGHISDMLKNLDLSKDELINAYITMQKGRKVEDRKADSKEDVLNLYTTDLTALARNRELDPVIGRKDEIMQVIHVLARRKKNNPILIGPPGVGKTVLIEGLAQRIVDAEVPETLLNKQVLLLDITEVIAGAKFKGEYEERIKAIREEVVAASGSIILFIDEFHTVTSSQNPGESSIASNMLKPALAKGQLQCIGATTQEEYKRYIEKDKALARRLQVLQIQEPSIEEAVDILHGLKHTYENHHSVIYTNNAIEAAVKLSDRYISEKYLPDKAIDIIDEAGARKHLSQIYIPPQIQKAEADKQKLEQLQTEAFKSKDFKNVAELQQKLLLIDEIIKESKKKWQKERVKTEIKVEEDDIAGVISDLTGIPLNRLVENEAERLLNMEKNIHMRIISQEHAVSAVCNAIRRNRARIKLQNRPIGSFLFLGPTGVGKTELAKALAEFLMGSESKLIRIDMSEYQERHTVSRMIGAPPGYVGYGEGGQLTEMVRRNPYSVILLDEIEKAHQDVYNLLLQILDEGKLTDGQGLEVSFMNTLIIGTSNIGSPILSRELKNIGFIQANGEQGYEDTKKTVMTEVKKIFKPEFINRLDDLIVFHTLSKDNIREIVKLELNKLKKGLQEHNIELTVEEEVMDFLAQNGYSETFGARPLKREIEKQLENTISQGVISGEIKKNSSIKAVLSDKNEIKIITQ
jgi:ATP-dependent Clp protease ATP-binding subunit ClpC